MTTIKQPRIDVLMSDGEQHEVALSIPDQIQWSRTSRSRGWAPDDELLAQTFMVWHALKRTGAYTGTWEEFSEGDAVWLAEHEDDADEDVQGSDTPTVPAS